MIHKFKLQTNAILLLVLLLLVSACNTNYQHTDPVSFNKGWTFSKGSFTGAQALDFDDDSWRALDLPHDWAIEGPFDIKYNARAGGLPFHGEGWYRKVFSLPKEAKGKHITLHFDGAMYNAKVWLNGNLVGHRPNGYVGFTVDLSTYAKFHEKNVIAVQLSPEDLSSRWYPGAGIYRNTWLEINNAVHVAKWGTFIKTPKVTNELAEITIETEIKNEGNIEQKIQLRTRILDKNNKQVAVVVDLIEASAGSITVVNQNTEVSQPEIWDLETPNLYTSVSEVIVDGDLMDRYKTSFGIRTIEYSADFGFKLNNKKTRFQGVCLHHDLGPLGTAVNERATERQLEIMKDMGANAIRTSHNPPSPEQVNLCDQLGLMIQVEAFDMWKKPKVENGYSKYYDEWHERDLKDMIRAFRNNPSVVMWSIGNEILEQQDKVNGRVIAKELATICKQDEVSTFIVTILLSP